MRQRKEEECNLQINTVPRSWCSGNPEKSKALMTPTNAKIAVLTGTRPRRSWRCQSYTRYRRDGLPRLPGDEGNDYTLSRFTLVTALFVSVSRTTSNPLFVTWGAITTTKKTRRRKSFGSISATIFVLRGKEDSTILRIGC